MGGISDWSRVSIPVPGPLNSFSGGGNALISFNSSGVLRVKIEACVNKADCTLLAGSVSVTGSSASWNWTFSGTEPYVSKTFGEKPIYLKVSDLDSAVSTFAGSYIYILAPQTSQQRDSSRQLGNFLNAMQGFLESLGAR